MNKIVEKQKNIMNTTLTIKIVAKDKEIEIANNCIQNSFKIFDYVVERFSRFIDNSELNFLNKNQGKWTKVSEELFYLVSYSLNLAKLTNGYFDPTIIDLLEMYGYDKNYNFSKLDDPNLNEKVSKYLKNRPIFTEIQLNEIEKTIKLSKGQRIELGGIGKGYAIDLAFDHIKKYFNNFLIDAGGDIRAMGKNVNRNKWKVGIKTTENHISYFIELNNEAIACSGNWARKVKHFHHLINPHTGKPTESNYSTVYVIAPTALESDSWATVAFLLGEEYLKTIIPKNYQYLYF